MKFFCLCVLGKIHRRRVNDNLIRFCVISLITTLVETVILLSHIPFILYSIVVTFITSPGLVYIALKPSGRRERIMFPIEAVVLVIFLNGITQLFSNLLGRQIPVAVYLLAAYGLEEILRKLLVRQKEESQNLYPVELYHRDRHMSAKAYYDSGNVLRTEIGEPVCFLDDGCIRNLELTKAGTVSFQTASSKDCETELYVLDGLKIQMNSEKILYEKCMVASSDFLFKDKEYQMLLHRDLLWKEK